VGLCPKRDQSGETDKELRISKCGDRYLRRLLVSAAQHILGPFGTESALRDYGLRLAQDGTAKAKKRAVVASHAWLMRFVEHRIGDRRINRLVRQWLKAG
jgi:transposase